MGIRDCINRIEELQEGIRGIRDTVNKVVKENEDVILSLNKDQMLLGRDSGGNVLTPGYLDDPYFDNRVQAEAYANMKYALEQQHVARIENPTIYPAKGKDTPNLIVTGLFQDNMFILNEGDSFLLGSTYVDSDDIDNKYGGKVFGLAPASAMFFYEHYIKPSLERLLFSTR